MSVSDRQASAFAAAKASGDGICPYCNAPLVPSDTPGRRRLKCDKPECRRADARARYVLRRGPLGEHPCPACGKPVVRVRNRRECCSDECTREIVNRKSRAARAEHYEPAIAAARRKARHDAMAGTAEGRQRLREIEDRKYARLKADPLRFARKIFLAKVRRFTAAGKPLQGEAFWSCWDSLLGTVPDAAIAKSASTSVIAVAERRRQLQIKAKGRSLGISPENVRKTIDLALADAAGILGCTRVTVSRLRRQLGLRSARKGGPQPKRTIPDTDLWGDTMPALAARYGCSMPSIAYQRRQARVRGYVPPPNERRGRTGMNHYAVWERLHASGVAVDVIAQAFGVQPEAVLQMPAYRRLSLGK